MPSRLLCLAGMIGLATQAQVPNVAGKNGKGSVVYQIWYFKSISETKGQERILFGGKISGLPLCLSLSSSLHTHTKQIKELQEEDSAKRGMRKRSLSLPDCLSFQPPLSRDAVTLVSHSYCYEFSIVISRLHSCHKAG